ncbi:MAG: hypothetical protein ACR2HG_00550 [Pyrinomonadaceae bacterium]
MNKFIQIFLCFAALISPSVSIAFETDQFNLPPEPLADIGAEVSFYAEDNLRQAVEKINAEITLRENCLKIRAAKTEKSKCGSPEKEKARLDYLRSEAAIAREVFNKLGAGFPPFTRSGSWMESHRFNARPARYKTDYSDSIFAVFPTDYLTISSTVNLYGSEFGTDKIAHIFQQGYTYYRINERGLAENLSSAEAIKRAIEWGQKSERTFYGKWISGVYSNADLCANYAGMKFYQNLTREIKIGSETRPPILQLKNGVWKFDENADLSPTFLKPFVSEHLNEAWNPSVYTNLFYLRSSVRRHVKKRACAEWRKLYPDFSKSDFTEKAQKLTLWHGEDYGFTASDDFITIADACFDD